MEKEILQRQRQKNFKTKLDNEMNRDSKRQLEPAQNNHPSRSIQMNHFQTNQKTVKSLKNIVYTKFKSPLRNQV